MGFPNDAWFGISRKSHDLVAVNEEWMFDFRAKHCCSHCKARLSEFGVLVVSPLYEEQPPPDAVQDGPWCLLMRRDLYCVLEGAFQSVHSAPVRGPHGLIYDAFVALSTSRLLVLRGARESVRGVCPVCKRILYYPLPHGYEYLVPSMFRPNQDAYLATMHALVVRGYLVERIKSVVRKGLSIKRIQIRDHAEDGLDPFTVEEPS